MSELIWSSVGWAGNACYFSRFLVQWAASERAGVSITPKVFWWLSLAGTLCLFAYTTQAGEPILLLGYTVTLVIYLRNIQIGRTQLDPARAGSRWNPLRATLVGLLAWILLMVFGLDRSTLQPSGNLWFMVVGLLGQAAWSSRFITQWVLAERSGRSELTPVFWWISLVGNALMLLYVIPLGDPIWIAGLAVGPVVQVRNLVLLAKARKSSSQAERVQRDEAGPLAAGPRRRWVTQRVALVGSLLLLGGIFIATAVSGDTRAAQRGESLVTPPAPSPRHAEELAFFALGDSGSMNAARARVGRAMATLAVEAAPDWVLLLGDNFSPDGIDSVDSPRWQAEFEQGYVASGLDVPFHPALGNHDYNGNVGAQIEYTRRSQRWVMPACYYKRSYAAGGVTAELFVLDTYPMRMEDDAVDAQLRWLEEQLGKSEATWKIVAGHHPAYSAGEQGGSLAVRWQLEPLFERYGVDLYLSGHNHDLELLTTPGSWLQVVSGAGAKVRPVKWRKDTLFAEAEPGFVWVRLSADTMELHFLTGERGLRFSHAVQR